MAASQRKPFEEKGAMTGHGSDRDKKRGGAFRSSQSCKFFGCKRTSTIIWWRKTRTPHDGEHLTARDKEKKNPQPTEKKVVERLSHGSEEIIHERPMVADNPRASHVVWAAQEHSMVAGNTRTFHGSEQSKTEGMTRTIALVAKNRQKEKQEKIESHLLRDRRKQARAGCRR